MTYYAKNQFLINFLKSYSHVRLDFAVGQYILRMFSISLFDHTLYYTYQADVFFFV